MVEIRNNKSRNTEIEENEVNDETRETRED
jgi:hypothetical protein